MGRYWCGEVLLVIGNQKPNLVKIEGRLTGKSHCQDISAVNVLSICNNGNKLMHDKAPAHKALLTTYFWRMKQSTI